MVGGVVGSEWQANSSHQSKLADKNTWRLRMCKSLRGQWAD